MTAFRGGELLFCCVDEGLKSREVSDQTQGLSHHNPASVHCFTFSRAGLQEVYLLPGWVFLLCLVLKSESTDSTGHFFMALISARLGSS